MWRPCPSMMGWMATCEWQNRKPAEIMSTECVRENITKSLLELCKFGAAPCELGSHWEHSARQMATGSTGERQEWQSTGEEWELHTVGGWHPFRGDEWELHTVGGIHGNPSSWEGGAGGTWVPVKPGLCGKTLLKTNWQQRMMTGLGLI